MIRLAFLSNDRLTLLLVIDFFDILSTAAVLADHSKRYLPKKEIKIRILLSRIVQELIDLSLGFENCRFVILSQESPCKAYALLRSLVVEDTD